jgi:hypothetical protein
MTDAGLPIGAAAGPIELHIRQSQGDYPKKASYCDEK